MDRTSTGRRRWPPRPVKTAACSPSSSTGASTAALDNGETFIADLDELGQAVGVHADLGGRPYATSSTSRARLPEADSSLVAIATNSFGVTMAAGALVNHTDLGVDVLVDWEGPADGNDTGGCDGEHLGGHLYGVYGLRLVGLGHPGRGHVRRADHAARRAAAVDRRPRPGPHRSRCRCSPRTSLRPHVPRAGRRSAHRVRLLGAWLSDPTSRAS